MCSSHFILKAKMNNIQEHLPCLVNKNLINLKSSKHQVIRETNTRTSKKYRTSTKKKHDKFNYVRSLQHVFFHG